jgi:choline transporter-like protein 2/4/5
MEQDKDNSTIVARSQITRKTERKLTDFFSCVCFGVFWLGMFIIAALSVRSGDPLSLLYANDYTGNTCGGNGRFLAADSWKARDLGATTVGGQSWSDFYKANPRVVYPRANVDAMLSKLQGAITKGVASGSVAGAASQVKIPNFFGICVNECPTQGSTVCSYEALKTLNDNGRLNSTDKLPFKADVTACYANAGNATATKANSTCAAIVNGCWNMELKTKSVWWRCVPTPDINVKVMCKDPLRNGKQWELTAEAQNSDNATVCKTSVTTSTSTGSTAVDTIFSSMDTAAAEIARWMGDVDSTKTVIFVTGIFCSFLLGYLYIYFIRSAAYYVVWSSFVCSVLVFLVITLILFAKAGILGTANQLAALQEQMSEYSDHATVIPAALPAALQASSDNKSNYKYAAITSTILLAILIALLIGMRERINTAITIIKEASKAVVAMPLVVFYPFITVIFVILLTVYWAFISAYIASSGTLASDTLADAANGVKVGQDKLNDLISKYKIWDGSINLDNTLSTASVNDSGAIRYMLIYYLFGMLWTNELIQAISLCTIAGAICGWYWKEVDLNAVNGNRKENDVNLGCCAVNVSRVAESPVWDSFKRTMRWHIGSLAQGALCVTVCKIIYKIFLYLQSKTAMITSNNPVAMMWKTIMMYCGSCLERAIKFVSRSAYILIAMEGMPFCEATKEAFYLIATNKGAVVSITVVSDIVLFLARLFITILSGLWCFTWIDHGAEFQENAVPGPPSNTILPVFVSMVFAYFISMAFTSVYEIAIDSILLCFCLDKNINKGGPYVMSDDLKKFVEGEMMDPFNMERSESFFFSKAVTTEGKISFGIGWDVTHDEGRPKNQDMDCACVAYKDGEKIDFVDYTQKQSKNAGFLSHSGDNLTGRGAGIDENITIDFSKIPEEVNQIVFICFVFSGVSFDKVRNLFIRGTEDHLVKKEVCRFNVDDMLGQEAAKTKRGLLFCKMEKSKDSGYWVLEAAGEMLDGHKYSEVHKEVVSTLHGAKIDPEDVQVQQYTPPPVSDNMPNPMRNLGRSGRGLGGGQQQQGGGGFQEAGGSGWMSQMGHQGMGQQQYIVTIPPNAVPGGPMMVQTYSGQMVMITVPQGCMPGSQIMVTV